MELSGAEVPERSYKIENPSNLSLEILEALKECQQPFTSKHTVSSEREAFLCLGHYYFEFVFIICRQTKL